jgi:hypothetical protein
MTEIEKIYIDSRDRISGDSSDFKIKLPRRVKVNNNSFFSIDNVNIPYTINTIETGHNNLYISQYSVTLYTTTYYKVELTNGYYSGASLVAEINNQITGYFGLSLVAVYNVASNTITFKTNNINIQSYIVTDTELEDETFYSGNHFIYDRLNHGSINYIIHNTVFHDTFDNVVGWTSEFLDLHKVKNIYIHSNALTNNNVITSHGDSNVIMKCPINCSYGNNILYNSATGDFLPCLSIPDISELDFYITDGKGRPINMHSMDISFSIIFKK